MSKVYVLDTNVFLHDPSALVAFKEHDLVVYAGVLREMDRFKIEPGELGYNARAFFRAMDYLTRRGNIREGIPLRLLVEGDERPNLDLSYNTIPSGRISVVGSAEDTLALSQYGIELKVDQQLMNLTRNLRDEGHDAVLVTQDISMRVQARAPPAEIPAEEYKADKKGVNIHDLFARTREIPVSPDILEEIAQQRPVSREHVPAIYPLPNEYVFFSADGTRLPARFDAERGFVALHDVRKGVQGIRPRNVEQLALLDALMNPDIRLVFGIGQAGTGKTLLTLAAGLEQTIEEQRYARTTVTRAIIPIGKDLGYLPGTLNEKMEPWRQPVIDALEVIFNSEKMRKAEKGKRKDGCDKGDTIAGTTEYYFTIGVLSVDPPTYIRGRSVPLLFYIVDEAQNLTPHEVKTIITRASEGTKVVLLGDPFQIDNKYLDERSNGLTVTASRLRGDPMCATVVLHKTERSALAELAARKL